MIYRLILLIWAIFLNGLFYSTPTQLRSQPPKGVQNASRRCKPNPDRLYERSRVLDELAVILNNAIPEYSKGVSKGFYSDNESAIGFFVVDLTNPTNKQLRIDDCIEFIDVYHVAPPDVYYSLSQIVVLEDGKLKVFRSVNCPSRGDRLEDAISYISAKLSHDKERDEIIDRVQNYRKYGFYGSLHHAVSICKDSK